MGSVESQSFIESGFASGSLHANYADKPIISDRARILNKKIHSIILYFEPLARILDRTNILPVSMFAPAALSTANLVHAGIYIPDNNGKGTIIEFGAYDTRREGDYYNQVHYFEGTSGLRFIEVSDETFWNKINQYKAPKYFECTVDNVMTIGELYKTAKFKKWKGNKYNLFKQNCQDFVKWAVRILGAKRVVWVNHTMSKIDIPAKILKALEENEDKAFVKFEKIPYFGSIAGFGEFVGECLFK